MNDKPGKWELFALPLAGLFLILCVAPFAYTTLLRDVFVIPKALPMSMGVALLWAALAWSGGGTFNRSLTPAIRALGIVAILSALLSVDTPLSLLGPHQQQFYALVPMALYALTYCAAANVESIPATAFVLLALIGAIAVSLPAMTQLRGGGFLAWSIQSGRIGSTFGSPVFLGSYLAIILPLAWVKREQRWANAIRWAALILISIALLATRTRGSVVAAVAGVLVIEHLRGRKVILWLAPAIPAFAFLWWIRSTAHNSDMGRVEIYRSAIMAWKIHPIIGWGPDTFSLAFRQFMTPRFIKANNGADFFIQLSAHNDILQVLTTLGLAGLAAYTFLYMEAARLLRRALATEPEALGIAGSFTALFVNAKFNPIPLAALVISAAMIGSIDRAVPEDHEGGSRTGSLAAAAVAFLLVVIFGLMCSAEFHQRQGENLAQTGHLIESAEQFNQAAQINPFDLYYTQRQMDYFWGILPKMPDVNKDMLAAFSHNVSENIGRLHPHDPTAHELRALSYLFEGTMLGRDRYWEADHELEVAQRLAPGFSMFTKRRTDLAELVKKQRRVQEHGDRQSEVVQRSEGVRLHHSR